MAKIVNKIKKAVGPDNSDLKEQFSLLQKMAKAKCAQFESEQKSKFLSGAAKELEIVGNGVMSYHNSQHVDLKREDSKAIKEAIEMFFKGKDGVINGFESNIETTLDTFLGNTIAKSIVGHKKLTIDELLYMVTEMIGEVQSEEVKAFIKELKEVWKMLEREEADKTLLKYQLADAPQKVLKSSSSNYLPLVSNFEELKMYAEENDWVVQEVLSDTSGLRRYDIEKNVPQRENPLLVFTHDSALAEDYQRWAEMIYEIEEVYGNVLLS